MLALASAMKALKLSYSEYFIRKGLYANHHYTIFNNARKSIVYETHMFPYVSRPSESRKNIACTEYKHIVIVSYEKVVRLTKG